MIITIPNTEEYDADFFNWLIEKIRLLVIADLNADKLIKIDNYINNNKFFISPFKKSISSKEALYIALYHLKIHEYWDRTVIAIDENIIIPNTKTKVLTVVKLINFGTMSVLGYPILIQKFKYVEEHLDELYKLFIKEH